MKFTKGKGSDFYNELNIRIEAYFSNNNISKYADMQIIVKAILLLIIYACCYSCIYIFPGQLEILIPAFMLLGLTAVILVFNLVHDASHYALSPKKYINKRIQYIGDLVGINTYIWDIRHNIQHHTFTNILGGDLIIENVPLMRFSEHQPYRRFHRFQPYYALLLYLLYSFYWVFIIDFRLFFRKDICNLKNLNHPGKEWILLIFFKLLYVTYILVFPIVFISMPAGMILALFFIMHFSAGLLLSIIGVVVHFVEGTSFPNPENGKLDNSWSEHELEATIDFAPSSKLINWITGGQNTHVAHHLYPHICHVHYYAMTPIIEKFCRQNGYPYKKESLWGAIRSHFRYIKRLSKPPDSEKQNTVIKGSGKWESVRWNEELGIGN
jgi:linoleoyl-CoA desaturase